ncbi:MAG: AraC family transcriptional regulator [Coriobacteriia bacterium]|nr:AraC family transcriptional regulator [Coriobacteriia bacterium]MCL2749742.1 AraC family transcriptional regulator [Coriobacteriia bacterium]
MYYPIQIPFVLNPVFSENVLYTEDIDERFCNYVICFWEMQSKHANPCIVENIIVTDGCIDLVVEPSEERIGFSGMSITDFSYKLRLPAWFFGARLAPGVFHQLTGRPAADAMDCFLPLAEVDEGFDPSSFFSLSPEAMKAKMKSMLIELMKNSSPNRFTKLFDELCDAPPANAKELSDLLHLSSRQCQRLFAEHFGYSPKIALSILRFQKCLKVLCSPKASPADILRITEYYDQSHMIKDFQKHLGITPLQLVHRYPRRNL